MSGSGDNEDAIREIDGAPCSRSDGTSSTILLPVGKSVFNTDVEMVAGNFIFAS